MLRYLRRWKDREMKRQRVRYASRERYTGIKIFLFYFFD